MQENETTRKKQHEKTKRMKINERLEKYENYVNTINFMSASRLRFAQWYLTAVEFSTQWNFAIRSFHIEFSYFYFIVNQMQPTQTKNRKKR